MKILKEIRHTCKHFIPICLLKSMIDAMMDILGIYAIKILLDALIEGNSKKLINKLLIISIIFLVYKAVDIVFTNIYMVITSSIIKLRLYQNIYDNHIDIIMKTYVGHEYYEKYFYSIKHGVDSKIRYILVLSGLARSILVFLIFGVYLNIISTWLFLFVLVTNIISYLYMKKAAKEKIDLSILTLSNVKVIDYINRILYHKEYNDAIKEINKKFIFKKMDDQNNHIIKCTKKSYRRISLNLFTSSFLKDIADRVIFLILGLQVIRKQVVFSDFTALYYGMTSLGNSFNSIILSAASLKELSLTIDKSQEFFELRKLLFNQTNEDFKLDENTNEIIKLENVKISIKNKMVLENVTFDILGTDRIVLIKGDNGSGKTLLLKTISAVNTIESGKIKYKNIDYNIIGYDNLKKLFSVMLQDFKIYQFSILENIICSSSYPINESRVLYSLDKVGIYEKLKRESIDLNYILSDEFNNNIGFSVGELQKIALARAIYKDSEILFLDESTSYYDEDSKSKFKKIIQDLSETRHIIMVVHGDYYDEIANLIIYINNGEITLKRKGREFEEKLL